MAKMTQCQRILRHMKDYGTIDPMVAIKGIRMHEIGIEDR